MGFQVQIAILELLVYKYKGMGNVLLLNGSLWMPTELCKLSQLVMYHQTFNKCNVTSNSNIKTCILSFSIIIYWDISNKKSWPKIVRSS